MDLPALGVPIHWTAFGTVVGYLLILAVMTTVLFVIPYLVFLAF